MATTSAARRYARALHSVAVEQGAGDSVAADLAALGQWLSDVPTLRQFLERPGIPRSRRRAALAALFESRVQPLTWRLIALLEGRRRTALLGEVCRAFAAERERRLGVRRVRVESAFELDPALEATVERHAEGLAGGAVVMDVATRPDLIGGLRIWIGDKVYDYSLAGSLAALRKALGAGGGRERRYAA
jgi:F-type H+-transporting ATPase subunit delta